MKSKELFVDWVEKIERWILLLALGLTVSIFISVGTCIYLIAQFTK